MRTTDVSGDARQRDPVTTRYLSLAGLIGPPLFASIIVLLTAIEWDFLHDLGWRAGPFDQPDSPVAWPSSTALGAYGFLQVLNFLVLGISAADAERYRTLGLPLYDPCVVAWLLMPEIFVGARHRVEVETESRFSQGRTVVDMEDLTGEAPNATVIDDLDNGAFLELLESRLGRI